MSQLAFLTSLSNPPATSGYCTTNPTETELPIRNDWSPLSHRHQFAIRSVIADGSDIVPPACITALNKYPHAPVTAPFANLPPPATLARPPTVALSAVPTKTLLWEALRMDGAAAALTPPASAPLLHELPDAADEAHPTSAWAAMFRGFTTPKPSMGIPKPCVSVPTPKFAIAVTPAISPAFNA